MIAQLSGRVTLFRFLQSLKGAIVVVVAVADPSLVTVAGTTNSEIAQFQNARLPISLSVLSSSNVTLARLVQSANAYEPSRLSLAGNTMLSKAVQLLKAPAVALALEVLVFPLAIVKAAVPPASNVTFDKAVQLRKALFAMFVTLLGMVTEVSALSWKA